MRWKVEKGRSVICQFVKSVAIQLHEDAGAILAIGTIVRMAIR